MKKLEKITLILVLILTLTLTISQINFTGKSIINKYSYTKAICNETGHCEDYYIECEEKTLTRMTPTGFSIQRFNDKTPPEIKKYCD